MALVGDLSEPGLIGLFAVFAVVVNAPYIIAWVAAGSLAASRAGLVLFGLALAGAAGVTLFTYWYIFFGERQKDAQDGLVFVVFPLYQTGVVLLAWGVAAAVAKWQARRG